MSHNIENRKNKEISGDKPAVRTFCREEVPMPWGIPQPEYCLPERPLDIEIGCGAGLHPLRYAASNPGRNLIALEQTSEKFGKFVGRLSRHPLMANLYPVHGDAIRWLSHHCREERVSRYFLLYPNPWPKKKDKNKRWHAMPFMEWIIKTLKTGGTITLATNERWYMDEAVHYLEAVWNMEPVEIISFRQGERPGRTHFELKYLARGQVCYQCIFRKNSRL